MSKQEQQETGVDQMTPQQKQAFEKWSGSWTQKVLKQSPTYHNSMNLRNWVSQWPLAEQPNTTATPNEVAEQQKQINKIIDKIRDNGKTVELKDGSVWKITDIDAKKVLTWNRGDKVDWVKSYSSYPGYYMTNLMENDPNLNSNVNAVAGAEMIKPPAPNGIKPPEPPGYFRDSSRISTIQTKGWTLTLENGTSWKIAPRDWAGVMRWQRGDRVRPEKSSDILYTYNLLNLDSGQQAQGNPQK
jgi:hypothetical protein